MLLFVPILVWQSSEGRITVFIISLVFLLLCEGLVSIPWHAEGWSDIMAFPSLEVINLESQTQIKRNILLAANHCAYILSLRMNSRFITYHIIERSVQSNINNFLTINVPLL